MRDLKKSSVVLAGFIVSNVFITQTVGARNGSIAQAQSTPSSSLNTPSPSAIEPISPPSAIEPTSPPSSVAPSSSQTGNRPGSTIEKVRRFPIAPVPFPGDSPRRLRQRTTPLGLPKLTTPDLRTTTSPSSNPTSGITGKIMVTYACPVVAVSKDCGVARPYTGPVKVMTLARDRVNRLRTDTEGNFAVRLTPGMYVVQPDAADLPMGTSQVVNVIPGGLLSVNFAFQGGVRVVDRSTSQPSSQSNNSNRQGNNSSSQGDNQGNNPSNNTNQ